MLKLSIITPFLGQTKDRFHLYNREQSLEEKFQMVQKIEGVDGVEVVYPYEVSTPQKTKALVEKYGLNFSAINVNIKAEPEFLNGGVTSPKQEVRAKAVQFMKEAKDFAEAVGADKVTCCPLADGYEFSFQSDYGLAWKRLIETFGAAGDYKKTIPLFVEYKPSETRGTCYLNNAAKTLCLLKDIGIKEMGVTLDFGHSMYGGNNPAEEVALLAESDFPYYIHINDNDGKWDWDYFCGTKHMLEYVEFLYYLKKYHYEDYLTSDTSPTRWDIQGVFEVNSRITTKIWNLLDDLQAKGFNEVVGDEDYLKVWRMLEDNLWRM